MACDRQLRFVFLTGVSKFSQACLFSGLNNLITLEPEFSAVCGYTEAELDAVFAPELHGLDRDEIRLWYNGHNWLGPEKVYNPFDILLLFRTRKFEAHWGRHAGLPRRPPVAAPALEGMVADDEPLSAFDVDDISGLPFQTGYLTIAGKEAADGGSLYRLPRGEAQPERAAAAGAGNGRGGDEAGGIRQADGGGREGRNAGRSSRPAPEQRPLRGLSGDPRPLALRGGGGSGRSGKRPPAVAWTWRVRDACTSSRSWTAGRKGGRRRRFGNAATLTSTGILGRRLMEFGREERNIVGFETA